MAKVLAVILIILGFLVLVFGLTCLSALIITWAVNITFGVWFHFTVSFWQGFALSLLISAITGIFRVQTKAGS